MSYNIPNHNMGLLEKPMITPNIITSIWYVYHGLSLLTYIFCLHTMATSVKHLFQITEHPYTLLCLLNYFASPFPHHSCPELDWKCRSIKKTFLSGSGNKFGQKNGLTIVVQKCKILHFFIPTLVRGLCKVLDSWNHDLIDLALCTILYMKMLNVIWTRYAFLWVQFHPNQKYKSNNHSKNYLIHIWH